MMHFRFRLHPTGELLGIIECPHPGKLFTALYEAGYSWESTHHTHRGRPISLNWVQSRAELEAICEKFGTQFGTPQ